MLLLLLLPHRMAPFRAIRQCSARSNNAQMQLSDLCKSFIVVKKSLKLHFPEKRNRSRVEVGLLRHFYTAFRIHNSLLLAALVMAAVCRFGPSKGCSWRIKSQMQLSAPESKSRFNFGGKKSVSGRSCFAHTLLNRFLCIHSLPLAAHAAVCLF